MRCVVCVWCRALYCAMVSGVVMQGGIVINFTVPRRVKTGAWCHLGSWLQNLMWMSKVPILPCKKDYQGFREEGRSLSHLERLSSWWWRKAASGGVRLY